MTSSTRRAGGGLEVARRLDRQDPLGHLRELFCVPPGTIYMDGNSLGLLSLPAQAAAIEALAQWREQAIGGWLEADPPWFTLGEELGRQMAPLVGAAPDSVVVTGATTVNLHNLLATFYRPCARRYRILADELNFPSDLYALRSHLALRGRDPAGDLRLVSSRDGRILEEEDIIRAMDDSVAVAVLPSVLYRSGQLLDIRRLTAAAHEQGVLMGFDISHSAGAVPHELDADGVDFAFWCTYKYLNGGPGSTGALYVNRRHHHLGGGLAGWWGYRKDRQFAMSLDWEAAPSAGAWQISTIPVLATAALRGALAVTTQAGIETIRAKSLDLTGYLVDMADAWLSGDEMGFAVGTPRDPGRRGGHVALEHVEAVRIVKALRARGVVPDFRPPNVIRLAPVALSNTFEDVWRVVEHLRQIAGGREYEAYAAEPDVVA